MEAIRVRPQQKFTETFQNVYALSRRFTRYMRLQKYTYFRQLFLYRYILDILGQALNKPAT